MKRVRMIALSHVLALLAGLLLRNVLQPTARSRAEAGVLADGLAADD